MSSSNAYITQAVAIVKDAVQQDSSGNYKQAFALYLRALEYFQKGLPAERNPSTRRLLTERVESYMERAEELKKILGSEEKESTGESATGNDAATESSLQQEADHWHAKVIELTEALEREREEHAETKAELELLQQKHDWLMWEKGSTDRSIASCLDSDLHRVEDDMNDRHHDDWAWLH